MKSVLARKNQSVLEHFARSNVLVAFDYDGTLAPIADTPDRACMRDETRALLGELCRAYPCAVISGRSVRDVRAHLAGVDVPHVIGNHGMEPGDDLGRFEDDVRALLPAFAAVAQAHSGVEVEDKRYSLSLHHRNARDKHAARAALRAAVLASPRAVRVVLGKQVMNVIPAGARDKGTALLALRAHIGADTAIFVGDDVTDEDVFRIRQPETLLSIRVGMNRTSAATYAIAGQRDIDALLRRLLVIRGATDHATGETTTPGTTAT